MHNSQPEENAARLGRLRAALRRNQVSADAPLAELRANFERAMVSTPLADGIDTDTVMLGELSTLRLTPRDRLSRGTVLLYLHGGAYVLGSARTAAPLASRLACAGGLPVVCPDYPLAPEAPHPAALEAVLAACRRLSADGTRVIIGGDSAGGGLAVAACIALRERDTEMPVGVIALSPWVDLTLTLSSVTENAELDPLVPPALLRRAATLYAGSNADLRTPTVSPRFADLAALPPLLVHASRAEVLRDDAQELADAARRDGVDVTFELWDDLPHVWHAFAPVLPEALAAIERVGAWLRASL